MTRDDLTDAFQRVHEIIFDCDGVLIESIAPKTDTFVDLLSPVDEKQEHAIRTLHGSHPGMHRSDVFRRSKVEILEEQVSDDEIEALCEQFHRRVQSFMPELPLVEGLESFLEAFREQWTYHVVSGAPQEELEEILYRQGIDTYFHRISGSPPGKPERAEDIVEQSDHNHDQFLLIGDAQEDLEVAEHLDVPMVFRPSTDHIQLEHPNILVTIRDFRELRDLLS